MKPSTLPMLCGVALAAMSTAGLSHWWSVRQFVTAINAGLPVSAPAQPAPAPVSIPAAAPVAKPAAAPVLAQAPKSAPVIPATDAAQKKFYETLISRMESLQNQNRDLLNQVAETNRDMMNLNFRVDTFSDSFRPLPVSEERADTSFLDGPGVLPPRAEPVIDLPFSE